MHKCYTFLIFMVLLLPSLGLSRWVRRKGWGLGWGKSQGGERERFGFPSPLPSPGPHVQGASSEAPGWDSPSLFQSPAHLSPLQPGPLLPLAL